MSRRPTPRRQAEGATAMVSTSPRSGSIGSRLGPVPTKPTTDSPLSASHQRTTSASRSRDQRAICAALSMRGGIRSVKPSFHDSTYTRATPSASAGVASRRRRSTSAVSQWNALARCIPRGLRPQGFKVRPRPGMGRKTGCLSSHPPRRTSTSCSRPRSRASRGDSAVHQDELEPVRDALLGKVFDHQVAGPVLGGGCGHHHRGHREARDVDGHDTLGALDASVGAAAVVEGEPAVRCPGCEVGVDDDHGRRPFRPGSQAWPVRRSPPYLDPACLARRT